MEKKLTRSDYLFILLFIFMLVSALGAFFFGVKLGTDRTEAKYSNILKLREEEKNGLAAYHQSYLVSFYHTVYLPFREFSGAWSEKLADIEEKGGKADAAAAMKEIAKLAEEKYDSIQTQTMPETSPLLQEGHQNYMKSLKLFADAAKSMQGKANQLSAPALLAEIEKDAYFSEAKNFALAAQKNFFDAIVKWNESVAGGSLTGADLLNNNALGFNEWNQLNLNLKNDYISGLLAASRQFKPFTPQDVTIRIDEIIRSGQAKKMNAANVPQVVDILLGTNGVRQGDFIRGKAKWYADETVPQLPFFFKQDP